MAFQMAHQSDDGVDHPESYWRIVFVRIDLVNHSGFFAFEGYHDATARADGKKGVGTKNYEMTGALFDNFFSDALLTGQQNPLGSAYVLAKSTKDTLDSDGITMVSFFESASNV